MRLNKPKVIENLYWRRSSGNLAMQTAVLSVMIETMWEKESEYPLPQRQRAENVLSWSKEVLGKIKLPRLTKVQCKQARIYAMFGPGWMFLPESAICQPADFYFDTRTGRAAFAKRIIEKEVIELVKMVKAAKGDPHSVPKLDLPHNCGIW